MLDAAAAISRARASRVRPTRARLSQAIRQRHRLEGDDVEGARGGEALRRANRRGRRGGRRPRRPALRGRPGRRRCRRTRRRPCGRRARRPRRRPRRRRRAAAMEISKSSRSEACPAVSTGPIAAGGPSPAQDAATTSSTRAFSVTMCRARRCSTSPSGVPSARRQAGDVGDVAQSRSRPAGAAACLALPPPVAVAAVGVVVRRAGVDDEQRQPGGGQVAAAPARCCGRGCRGTARAPAVHSSDADWSRIPVGAPTKSFSDRRASVDQVVAGRAPGATQVAQRQGDRAGQRRRRGQPRPDRDVAVDQHAHAAGQPLARARARPRPGSPPSRRAGRAPGRRRPRSTTSPSPLQRGQREPAVVAPGRPRRGWCAAARSAARSRRCSRCARR